MNNTNQFYYFWSKALII